MTNEQIIGGFGLSLLVNAVAITRWGYRKVRDAEIAQTFANDVATNHLPHIQHALTLIANALHIDLPEPPPIRFMAFKDKS